MSDEGSLELDVESQIFSLDPSKVVFASRLTVEVEKFFSWRTDEVTDVANQDWDREEGLQYVNPTLNH